TTLRAQLLQSTLQACKSVKAKRLFLALASTVGHKWYDDLNLGSIDLGVGKRSIINSGYLHPEFEITVPKTWVDS
ncbi:MAG: type IV toxin-antitoxin system AbiEi family antitoxin domain-containing protein, partial [Pseudomonadales bacterium]|nr:type IV toxin-antitoxin system AbiEi family antitoxin domain-containing protein [Pseudomonadales bacterium]